MRIAIAIQFRLKLTEGKETQCARFVGCCRFVWNRALAVKKEAWERERKSVSRFELDALLVEWKKELEASPSGPRRSRKPMKRKWF